MFQTFQLSDIIKMEYANFVFKFENKLLVSSFDNYFMQLGRVNKYNTRQRQNKGYYISIQLHSSPGEKGFITLV